MDIEEDIQKRGWLYSENDVLNKTVREVLDDINKMDGAEFVEWVRKNRSKDWGICGYD